MSISVAFTSPGFAIGNPYIDEDGGLSFRAETVACHHAVAKSPVLDTALDGRIRITFWNDSLVPELVLPSKGNSRGRVEYLVYDYLRRYKPTIRSCQVQLRTMEGNTFHRMLPGMRLLAAIPTAENITGPSVIHCYPWVVCMEMLRMILRQRFGTTDAVADVGAWRLQVNSRIRDEPDQRLLKMVPVGDGPVLANAVGFGLQAGMPKRTYISMLDDPEGDLIEEDEDILDPGRGSDDFEVEWGANHTHTHMHTIQPRFNQDSTRIQPGFNQINHVKTQCLFNKRIMPVGGVPSSNDHMPRG